MKKVNWFRFALLNLLGLSIFALALTFLTQISREQTDPQPRFWDKVNFGGLFVCTGFVGIACFFAQIMASSGQTLASYIKYGAIKKSGLFDEHTGNIKKPNLFICVMAGFMFLVGL